MAIDRLPSPGAGIPTSTVTAKGDLIAGTANNAVSRLAVGADGTTLVADSTQSTGLKWATPAGGGKVLQVVHSSYSTSKTSTSGTYVDTGLTATITPSAVSSKVLVIFSQNSNAKTQFGSGDGATLGIKLLRGSTDLVTVAQNDGYSTSSFGFRFGSISGQYLDSPSTTSPTTYKCQFANTNNNVGEVAVNQNNSTSTIVLLEIGA